MSTRDPAVLAAVTLILGTVVVAAAYLPARQATRVDALDVLRGE